MKLIIERSFQIQEQFRPRPIIVGANQANSSPFVVMTSWSGRQEAEQQANKLIESCQSVLSSVSDAEKIPELLISQLQQLSKFIFKSENSRQLRLIFECVLMVTSNNILYWSQVGKPNIYLVRESNIYSLSATTDLGVYAANMPPLPATGLGLSENLTVQSGKIHLQDQDNIFLSAHSYEPVWPSSDNQVTFESLFSSLAGNSSPQPFWCAMISRDEN